MGHICRLTVAPASAAYFPAGNSERSRAMGRAGEVDHLMTRDAQPTWPGFCPGGAGEDDAPMCVRLGDGHESWRDTRVRPIFAQRRRSGDRASQLGPKGNLSREASLRRWPSSPGRPSVPPGSAGHLQCNLGDRIGRATNPDAKPGHAEEPDGRIRDIDTTLGGEGETCVGSPWPPLPPPPQRGPLASWYRFPSPMSLSKELMNAAMVHVRGQMVIGSSW